MVFARKVASAAVKVQALYRGWRAGANSLPGTVRLLRTMMRAAEAEDVVVATGEITQVEPTLTLTLTQLLR